MALGGAEVASASRRRGKRRQKRAAIKLSAPRHSPTEECSGPLHLYNGPRLPANPLGETEFTDHLEFGQSIK